MWTAGAEATGRLLRPLTDDRAASSPFNVRPGGRAGGCRTGAQDTTPAHEQGPRVTSGLGTCQIPPESGLGLAGRLGEVMVSPRGTSLCRRSRVGSPGRRVRGHTKSTWPGPHLVPLPPVARAWLGGARDPGPVRTPAGRARPPFQASLSQPAPAGGPAPAREVSSARSTSFLSPRASGCRELPFGSSRSVHRGSEKASSSA